MDNGAIAIDCGTSWTANRVLDYLNKNRLRLEYIFITHSHFDHVMGMNRFKKRFETAVVAHTRNKRGDLKVKDGDAIDALDRQLTLIVTHTGIHKADHVWYYDKNNRILFIGDHLPTPILLRTLKERHGAEPELLLPGHGSPTRLSNLVF